MSEFKYINEYERDETQKYEGTYSAEEVELNKRLLAECSKENIDFDLVEELLKQGADPLGATEVYGWGLLEHVYEELVMNSYDDIGSINLPKITEVFLKNGMDIASPRIPYDGNNSIHPLRFFPADEYSIVAFKLLLDYGVDADSVAEFWDRCIFDQINVNYDDPNSEEWHDWFVWLMKTIMLISSYDHIINNDEDLRNLIGYTYNSYDIHNFREWDNFYYEFDTSRCTRFPELLKSVVRIYDKNTNEEVWKIGFRLKEGEF